MTNEAKILTGIGIVTLLIVVGAAFLFGGKPTPNTPVKITEDQSKILIRENSHIHGPKDAKVTIVEFGDFQCPACGVSYPIVEQILKTFDGKIKFVFREYPLPGHANGRISAYAAEASGEQGKFFEMYNQLYDNQKEWGEDKNPMQFFEKYAKNIGLDVDKFKKDIEEKKYDARIQKDINDGQTLGVTATPTFFINGEKITGGMSFEDFKAKIESILKSS